MRHYSLPEFFISENNIYDKGAVFIISTKRPYYIGKVYRYKSVEEWKKNKEKRENRNNPKGENWRCELNGYMIYVELITCFDYDRARENFFTDNAQENFEHGIVLYMAKFFREERIEPNKSYFKRYAVPEPPNEGS